MKTRLKVLCWLFVAAYAAVIVHFVVTNIASELSDFNEGFKAGMESANPRNGDAKKSSMSSLFFESAYLKLTPKIQGSYPDKLINEKTGEVMAAEIERVHLSVRDLPKVPWYLTVGNVLAVLLAFLMMGIVIYIPILSFKVIKSIVKNDIFDEKNIRRIRRVGYSLIVVFLIGVYYAIVLKATALQIVSLKDYKIISSLDSDDIFIITLGIVVLIFAEVLKIATQMKEEQDLTV